MSMHPWQQLSGEAAGSTTPAQQLSQMWHLLEREISMVQACVGSKSPCPRHRCHC